MLFLLSGHIEIGKTRWLEALVATLRAHDIESFGVLAPGQWIKTSPKCTDTTNSDPEIEPYEKRGIDNILLPGERRIVFAYRNDLAPIELRNTCSQAQKAQLRWLIQDSAIQEVNDHFATLASATPCDYAPRLLVVDELGQLELIFKKGLSEAVSLLEHAAPGQFSHAIVVVRDTLLEKAREHFASSPWGDIEIISPDAEGENRVFKAFGINYEL